MNEIHSLVLPTPEQVEWADAEIGVIIHLDLPTFRKEPYRFRDHWGDPIPAVEFAPSDLNTDQWLEAAHKMGAKYAVLVAKHCTGFSLWPTDVHGYSVKSSPWKDGKGDVVGDFFASCQKYGIRPGLYYSASCNQYKNVDNPGLVRSGDAKAQEEYNAMVMTQLTELWTRYGKIFEIWFDGGCLPVEKGGPDIAGLLHRLQPDAVVFQGPENTKSLLRWCGNERAEASENCSSIFNYGQQDATGTMERLDIGDPYGDTWCPAECDMPNRDAHRSYAGGWFWKAGEEDAIFPAEVLFDQYLKSVGRNGNLLVGMVIDTDGHFPQKDTEEFAKFGAEVRRIFSVPLADVVTRPSEDVFELCIPQGEEAPGYVAIGEDIAQGERITGYRLEAFDKAGATVFTYDGQIISHKRILEIPADSVKLRLTVLSKKADVEVKFFRAYRK